MTYLARVGRNVSTGDAPKFFAGDPGAPGAKGGDKRLTIRQENILVRNRHRKNSQLTYRGPRGPSGGTHER